MGGERLELEEARAIIRMLTEQAVLDSQACRICDGLLDGSQEDGGHKVRCPVLTAVEYLGGREAPVQQDLWSG